MAGILALAVAQARQDRGQLGAWILGIALLGFATATAVATEFGSEAERAGIIAVAAANPAFRFLRGAPDGTGLGAVVFFQGYAFTAVLAGLMSTFLVVRHTRSEEESGRAELVGSVPVSRTAPLAATLLVGTTANLVLLVLLAAGYAAAGLPVAGSMAAAYAVGSVGIVFVGAAGLLAQLLPTGRSANGMAALLVGLAYAVRGVGDALGRPDALLASAAPAWPSLFSPIGWGQRMRPFTAPDFVPVAVLAAAALLLAGAAVLVRERRDLGASLLAVGPGPAAAGAGGRSFLGLAWRLQRGTVAGWAAGAAAFGAMVGGLGPVVADAVAGNDSLAELVGRLVPGSRAGIIGIFSAALMGIAGVLAAAAGVQAVVRLHAEESEGRAELLLAGPAPRGRWFRANMVVAVLSVVVVALVAGVVAAGTLRLSGTAWTESGDLALAGLAHVPAALVVTMAAAVVFAAAPRLSAPAGWGLLVAALFLGQFGGLLRLPEWLRSASPFHHSSALPVEALDLPSVLVMLAVCAALAAGATALLRHRDLVP